MSLSSATKAGQLRGLDPTSVSNFFSAQIEANKLVQTQVDILQGALLSAGIFATVRNDGTYYQLLVSKEDSTTARKVLEALAEVRRP